MYNLLPIKLYWLFFCTQNALLWQVLLSIAASAPFSQGMRVQKQHDNIVINDKLLEGREDHQ